MVPMSVSSRVVLGIGYENFIIYYMSIAAFKKTFTDVTNTAHGGAAPLALPRSSYQQRRHRRRVRHRRR
eukprot:6201154-Pleurochrysis_carterae.AAC.1